MSLCGTKREPPWKNKEATTRVFLSRALPVYLLRFSTRFRGEKAQRRLLDEATGTMLLVFGARRSAKGSRRLWTFAQQTRNAGFCPLEAAKGRLATERKPALDAVTPKAHLFLVSGVRRLQWATGREKIMILVSYYTHQL